MICIRILAKMIEFCTKKRMALAILSLAFVSGIVLVMENNLSSSHGLKDLTSHPPGNGTQDCWKPEILEECRPCTNFENKVHNICKTTGYWEKVKCTSPKKKEEYRSCPKITWIEERSFWLFETLMTLFGSVSYGVVHLRQKRLDRMLMDKVNRQIASGV